MKIRVVVHEAEKEGRMVRLSAPVHGGKPLKKGLLKHLLKMAELDEKDLR